MCFRFLAVLSLLGALVLSPGCDRRLDPGGGGGVALANNLHRAGRVEFFAGGAELAGPVERAAQRLARPGVATAVLATGAAGDGEAARVVIGAFDDALVGELMARAGVAVAGGELTFLGREYRSADVLLSLCCEDPRRPRLPVTLLAAEDERRIVDALPRLRVGFRPGLTLHARGSRALTVRLALDGTPFANSLVEWAPRVLAEPGAYRAQSVAPAGGASWALRVAREIDPEVAADYVERVQAARVRLGAWIELPEAGAQVLVAEAHLDGFLGGEPVDRWAHFDRASGLLHALLLDGAPDDGGAAAAGGWATDALGVAATDWLADAVGLDAAGTYWGVPLEEWCGRSLLAAAPSFARLCEAGDGGRSPHELRPLRALLVRVVREQPQGAELLRRIWRGAAAFDEVEDEFAARLATLAGAASARAPRAFPKRFRGAVVTQPSPGTGAGFGTRGCATSLAELASLGADAAGFAVSFVSQPGPGDGRPLGPRTHAASVEGDVAVAAALAQARAQGLGTTLLLPTLLSAPSAGPAGDVVRITAAHWDELFEANERCARHCALLAELCGVDVLSLGEGMPETVRTVWTLDEEENAVQRLAREKKAAGWDATVAAARAGFGGSLTFASAAPRKTEWIGFMGDLDAVGMRFLRDLARDETPGAPSDEAAMRRLAHDLGECAKAAGDKPWIVLPAGFRSTARAWRGPNEANGGATDLSEQARLLRALAGALREAGDDAPGGLLVWRWSSDPHAGGAADRDYVLQNKPALAELPALFGRE